MIDEDGFDLRWNGALIRSQHWHFHSQLLARYGIVLAPGEFSKIISDVKNGTALLVKQRSRRRAIYSVRIRRVNERIYILAAGRNLVTAWPPDKRLNEIRRQLLAVVANNSDETCPEQKFSDLDTAPSSGIAASEGESSVVNGRHLPIHSLSAAREPKIGVDAPGIQLDIAGSNMLDVDRVSAGERPQE